jgi:hypothetical protein
VEKYDLILGVFVLPRDLVSSHAIAIAAMCGVISMVQAKISKRMKSKRLDGGEGGILAIECRDLYRLA